MNKILFNGHEIEVISCFIQRNTLYINIRGEVVDKRILELINYEGVVDYYENNMNGLEYVTYQGMFNNASLKKSLGFYYLECLLDGAEA